MNVLCTLPNSTVIAILGVVGGKKYDRVPFVSQPGDTTDWAIS